jgi:retron-type reverse transcriptase
MQKRKFFVGGKKYVGGYAHGLFEEIISYQNILRAWEEFSFDKTKRMDVLRFEARLEQEVIALHDELINGSYKHGGYQRFVVSDPKRRVIHKAGVRDRLLHHAVHRIMYPHIDKRFIFDSFSSRDNKGTHAALKRFRLFAWKLSRNRTQTVWVLQMDIRKFFHSIDHGVLIDELKSYVGKDAMLMSLLESIIASFSVGDGKGMPLGNLTSQLFSNIYLNPLDQYIKRVLRAKYYIRYADDMTILSKNRMELEKLVPIISDYLEERLSVELHPNKLSIRPWHKGIDLLGFVSYPHKTIMRPSTERRMMKRLAFSTHGTFLMQQNAIYSRLKFERA